MQVIFGLCAGQTRERDTETHSGTHAIHLRSGVPVVAGERPLCQERLFQ
jgi:hypothetical protein